MNDKRYMLIIAICLIFLSILVYSIHFLIFGKVDYILSYFLLHLAFVPIEVLLVSLIIEKILDYREKKKILEKLNMVVGSFFNSVGEELLKIILEGDVGNIRDYLKISDEWNDKTYEETKKLLMNYDCNIDIEKIDLYKLKNLLERNKEFLLRLMENPLLLEHESFTELLLAVFHLADELHRREDLSNLPKSDLDHLKNDIIRVYKLLIIQWLNYLMHLKDNYPYLYSLCLRANPFDNKSIIIEEDDK
ncbi:TPA: hypothetical protein HA335_05715 [Methanocaldococcus jannaschii]|uniref:Uncharacterized protein MJ1433 n=2 Tax=Methanocaldococcus jannaschii TaxID=2190 RepID=Y1433_METJA|nr:hypothetical protein [Methanocaldococcus jannaschii]Q58828.1 RecName: Full=Uncharacterized protein MJ1433 [Methanocaldococcus jannaschii DSM 2661]AAB99443.1 conserved hypothetical protein [Methanocaldococcus jannaschii DSM 2661]HII60047.1 hypothetical protein [Methanocaldococcus jannaschii]